MAKHCKRPAIRRVGPMPTARSTSRNPTRRRQVILRARSAPQSERDGWALRRCPASRHPPATNQQKSPAESGRGQFAGRKCHVARCAIPRGLSSLSPICGRSIEIRNQRPPRVPSPLQRHQPHNLLLAVRVSAALYVTLSGGNGVAGEHGLPRLMGAPLRNRLRRP